MIFIYNIFIYLYNAAVHTASLFNRKAKLWVTGRKNIFEKLTADIGFSTNVIWMHCASLGEFEQGRPVIEALRKTYPGQKILLTFFSPSGYEIRKHYSEADWVYYLPIDTPANAKRFMEIINPVLAIFVKYEYWYNYLNNLSQKNIPTILISALFRKDAVFFKWYGGLHRKMLEFFSHLFVQNQASCQLIQKFITTDRITIAGDTRFDRVTEIANQFQPVTPIDIFTRHRHVIVAGSTWPEDEKNLAALYSALNKDVLLIIAPHDISDNHLQFIKRLFNASVLYSDFIKDPSKYTAAGVLIIDNIGLLARLYYYGTICYIGGGFNKSGIHNTLEAAVYGRPVIYGPNFNKFAEANELIKNGGGFRYNNYNELLSLIKKLIKNEKLLLESGNAAGQYVISQVGATRKIVEWISQNVF